jgi:hypothetical protein
MIFESCWIHGDNIETHKEYFDGDGLSINVEQILNSLFEVN